jgi:hypothetical protein
VANVTLEYTDASTTSRAFTLLSMRGVDNFDEVQWAGQQFTHLDGSLTEEIVGFKRVFTLDFGVLTSLSDARFLLSFCAAPFKRIYFSSIVSSVTLDEPRMSFEWESDVQTGRRLVLRLVETVMHQWPDRQIEAEQLAYIKCKVKVEGTQTSPESFQTGTGKLATDETGQSYPTFSSATHVFSVLCNSAPYQEAHVNVTGLATVSGGKLNFNLAVQDSGKAFSDGYFYTDIVIIAQAKP